MYSYNMTGLLGRKMHFIRVICYYFRPGHGMKILNIRKYHIKIPTLAQRCLVKIPTPGASIPLSKFPIFLIWQWKSPHDVHKLPPPPTSWTKNLSKSLPIIQRWQVQGMLFQKLYAILCGSFAAILVKTGFSCQTKEIKFLYDNSWLLYTHDAKWIVKTTNIPIHVGGVQIKWLTRHPVKLFKWINNLYLQYWYIIITLLSGWLLCSYHFKTDNCMINCNMN